MSLDDEICENCLKEKLSDWSKQETQKLIYSCYGINKEIKNIYYSDYCSKINCKNRFILAAGTYCIEFSGRRSK